MADGTYQDKVYMKQGAETLVVASGGTIDIEAGGKMQRDGTDVIADWSFEGTVAVAGAALVIPVTTATVTKTTGGVEALTLADGTAGQVLTISLTATGGDGTLTPASSTGWATCVFTAAGDTLTVKFVDATIGWIVYGTAGVLAPPVLSV